MAASPKTTFRHPCSRCGKAQRREALIFSGHSRSYYCRDFAGCDRRAKKAAS